MRHAYRYGGRLVVVNLGITVAVVTVATHFGVPYVIASFGGGRGLHLLELRADCHWVLTGSAPTAA